MIFSDNYDKLIEAQKAYNAQVQKSPILTELDYVTDFFGSTFSSAENKFKQVYNHLTTINTKTNRVVNYSSISDNSLQAHTVIADVVKNTGVSQQFLTTNATCTVVTMPNLVINYSLDNSTSALSVTNNYAVSTMSSTINSETTRVNKIAFPLTLSGKQYVVVREQTNVSSPAGTRAEINDFVIDPKTKVISYIRNYSQIVKSDGYTSKIQNVYFNGGKDCIFTSKLNDDKPATLSVENRPLIFEPTKTKINDYNSEFTPNFSFSANFDLLKANSKKLGKAVSTATNNLGFGNMFSGLASKNIK